MPTPDEKPPEPRINVNFRTTREVVEHIDRMATKENRTRSQMIRVLVSEAIQRRAGR